MATIGEKAREVGFPTMAQRAAYISGAYDVLGEIEKIICDDGYFPANRIHRAKELIKELRGK